MRAAAARAARLTAEDAADADAFVFRPADALARWDVLRALRAATGDALPEAPAAAWLRAWVDAGQGLLAICEAASAGNPAEGAAVWARFRLAAGWLPMDLRPALDSVRPLFRERFGLAVQVVAHSATHASVDAR